MRKFDGKWKRNELFSDSHIIDDFHPVVFPDYIVNGIATSAVIVAGKLATN